MGSLPRWLAVDAGCRVLSTDARWSLAGLGLLVLAAGSPDLTAQAPRILRGRVVAEGTRQPLAGAEVVLMDLGRLSRTGLSGSFELQVPPPPYRIQVRRIGYHARAYRIKNTADTLEVEFFLAPAAVQLDSISVLGKAASVSARLVDFERRRQVSATGQFLTLDDLTRYGDNRLGDALRRVRGIRVVPFGTGGQTVVSMRGVSGFSGESCYLAVWLDGILVTSPGRPYDLEVQRIARLAAVEVYSGPAQVPIEFDAPGNSCGVLVLWTKDR